MRRFSLETISASTAKIKLSREKVGFVVKTDEGWSGYAKVGNREATAINRNKHKCFYTIMRALS